MTRSFFVTALTALVLTACASSIRPGTPSDGGHVSDVVATDAVRSCEGPTDALCAVGTRCPAGDGCNTCLCQPDLTLVCTEIACAPADAGVVCSASRPCGGAQECVYPFACPIDGEAVGMCEPPTPCTEPETYCACDGTTYNACVPTRPTAHMNACEGPAIDSGHTLCPSGVRVSAAGSCVGPEGDPLPTECCTGYPCDPRGVACALRMPVCPAGQWAVVAGGCWGACVPAELCAAIACDPARAACPPGGVCNGVTMRCEIGRL